LQDSRGPAAEDPLHAGRRGEGAGKRHRGRAEALRRGSGCETRKRSDRPDESGDRGERIGKPKGEEKVGRAVRLERMILRGTEERDLDAVLKMEADARRWVIAWPQKAHRDAMRDPDA